MNLYEQILAMFTKSGIEIEAGKLDVLKSHLKEVEIKTSDDGKLTPSEFKEYLDAAVVKISDLTKKLESQEAAHAKVLEEIEANNKKSQSEKIKKLLDDAVKAGKLTPEDAKFSDDDTQKGTYQKRLEKDYQEWSSEIEKRSGTPDDDKTKSPKPDTKPETAKVGILGSQVSSKIMDYVNKQSS